MPRCPQARAHEPSSLAAQAFDRLQAVVVHHEIALRPFMVAAHDGLVLDRPAKQLPRCQSGQGEQSDPDIDLC